MCIAKAKGNVSECIQRLNEYLKVFQTDTVAVSAMSTVVYSTLDDKAWGGPVGNRG